MEFSTSILIESMEEYFRAEKHLKDRGYSPPIFKIKMRAKEKIDRQIQLFKAQKPQRQIPFKTVKN